jgi:hypothetical protein
MQAHLQQRQLDTDLFDKRFHVYLGVRGFLTAILKGQGAVDAEYYHQFEVGTRPAKFLFGSDVTTFLS